MEDFIEFLERRAGGSLRVVSWYDGDDFGVWHVRDDLDRDAVNRRVAFLSVRMIGGGHSDDGQPMEVLGPEEATVQIREEVVILRFPTGDGRGIVVSLDVDVARDLHGFVLECAERLRGEEFE